MAVRILTAVLMVLTVAAGPYYNPGRSAAASQRTPAGKKAYGFALALSADAPSVPLGQPVWVTLEIRNVTGTDQSASAAARADTNAFDFSITNQKTHATARENPDNRFGLDSIGGPLRGNPVPVGTSIYLKFLLNELYLMQERGTYVVHLKKVSMRINGKMVTMPPSNTVSITII